LPFCVYRCSAYFRYFQRTGLTYPSPDRKLSVIVERSNGGATTGYWSDVYLDPKHEEIAQGAGIFDIHWRDASNLEIRYQGEDPTAFFYRGIYYAEGKKICNIDVWKNGEKLQANP
jgi:hypothetical protein